MVPAQQDGLHGDGDALDVLGPVLGAVDLFQQTRPGGPAVDPVQAVAQEQDLGPLVWLDV